MNGAEITASIREKPEIANLIDAFKANPEAAAAVKLLESFWGELALLRAKDTSIDALMVAAWNSHMDVNAGGLANADDFLISLLKAMPHKP